MLDAYDVVVPFVDHLGIRLVDWREGSAELAYSPQSEHVNNFKSVHGGVVMTLLDVAMARAGRSCRPEDGLVTVEMKTSFMRASMGPLIARGQLLHSTKSLAFVEGKVIDSIGQTCAVATGTFKFVRPSSPSAPRSTD